MRFHCLIRTSTGEISHFQKIPSIWGKKEKPPIFHIIEVEVNDENEIHEIKNFYKYDFDRKKFIKHVERIQKHLERFNVQINSVSKRLNSNNQKENKDELSRELNSLQESKKDFISKINTLPIEKNKKIIELVTNKTKHSKVKESIERGFEIGWLQ